MTDRILDFLQFHFPHYTFEFTRYANEPVVQAEMLWVKAKQTYHFYDVFLALKMGKKHDLVHGLSLFLDEHDIIRGAHRLRNSALRLQEKFPILLQRAKSSHFTKSLFGIFMRWFIIRARPTHSQQSGRNTGFRPVMPLYHPL